MLIELPARLAHPSLAALHPRDDRLGIKRELHTLRVGRLGLRVPSVYTLARELLLGSPQRSTPPLTGAQMLGQLVPARLAVERILGSVNLARLLQNLPRELLVVNI